MIRTSSILFWFGLIIAASLALYRTSDRAHELKQQLHEINASIETEQQRIHVLKAEWVYLANPARVETSTKKHLALRPTATQQITTLDNLAEALPTRREAMASATVSATPLVNIKTSLAPRATVADISTRKATTNVAEAIVHVNDHMIIQKTASAQQFPNNIGALINALTPRP